MDAISWLIATVQLVSKYALVNTHTSHDFLLAMMSTSVSYASEQITHTRNYAGELCYTRFVRINMHSNPS